MKWLVTIAIVLLTLSCRKSDNSGSIAANHDPDEIPPGFPEIIYPEDNKYTYDRWKLGKKLFFERLLSRDSSISCSSCHQPQLAFSDDKAISPGVEGNLGSRNAPSLANVAYHPYYTSDGGVPTLEMQVLVPVQEHAEFDYNIIEIGKRLKSHTEYQELSLKAYEREPDYFVITRALACFERSLISGNSNYDKYRYQNNVHALKVREKRGMELFFSERTNCSQCHSGFNFSNYAFENNGLYEVYQDPGRFRLTQREEDKHLFKVPGLRNVALTAPYMHDGSVNSLEEVIDHYVSGGAIHPQKSKLIKPLTINDNEKQDLIAFLRSLTDHDFANNALYREDP